MTGKNHLIFGIGAGAALYWDILVTQQDPGLVSLKMFTTICSLTMLGCVVPDIDNPKSGIGHKLKILSVPINKLFGHRTLFHSITLFALICCGLFYYFGNTSFLNNMYFTAFFTGYIGHLIQDTFTTGGTPWLYPFIRSRISLVDMHYGSKKEFPVTVCLLIIYGFIIIKKTDIINYFSTFF